MADRITGAEALIRALEHENVELIFGLPGGCILPVYDPLLDSRSATSSCATSRAPATWPRATPTRPAGPASPWSRPGPAATNIVTPLMRRLHGLDPDGRASPARSRPRRSAPTPSRSATPSASPAACTKHNELVMSAAGHPAGGPPGVPHRHHRPPRPGAGRHPQGRASRTTMDWYWPTDQEVLDRLPGYRPNVKGHPRMIKEAARLILASERPVIYAGGGILKARAAEALRELAELTDIPVVTTLMARGAFPDDHPLCLGMPGMHGNYTAVTAHAEGRPADRARRPLRRPGHRQGRRRSRPSAKIIHVDIDPAEQGKVRRPDVPIVGDCHVVIEELITRSRRCSRPAPSRPTRRRGRARSSGWQEQFPLTYEQSEPGDALKPQYCLEQLRDNAPDGHDRRPRASASTRCGPRSTGKFNDPYTWVNSGGLGTMGFSRPGRDRRQGRPARPHGVGRRRRRLLPDDRPGAGDRGGRAHPDQGRASSTTPTSAWSASGRRCSTTSATPRCTSRPTCPTT